MGCGVSFESSWWARIHGIAKTYAEWVWHPSWIGELWRSFLYTHFLFILHPLFSPGVFKLQFTIGLGYFLTFVYNFCRFTVLSSVDAINAFKPRFFPSGSLSVMPALMSAFLSFILIALCYCKSLMNRIAKAWIYKSKYYYITSKY